MILVTLFGYFSNGGVHGFVLKAGAFSAIDFPGASGTQAFGINNNGDVVGYYETLGGGTRAFLYSNGQFSTLATPGRSSLEIGHLRQGGEPSDGPAKISLDIPEVFL